MSNHNKETDARCPHCYRHYVEGTAAWALYMMRMGHKVTNPKYDPRVCHLPEGGMIHINGVETIAGNLWIDYWCIDLPDGWEIYEEPQPLLADAQVGWLCKLRNGEWRQIKGFGDSWGTNDCLNPNLFTVFLTDGTTRNIYGTYLGTTANPLPNDIIATEPIASEGSAEWALWQMKQGKIVSNNSFTEPLRLYQYTIYTIGGKVYCSANEFVDTVAHKSGWQLYEPEPPKEPEIVAHKQHANCLVCGKVIEGLLDGHATVSIKRYSISSLYDSTYSHYCGKCFLELGFDKTERELRNKQQPIAEPEPKFAVGDWAKYDIDSYLRVIETPGRERTLCKTLSGVIVYPYTSCLTKVSPSEVVIHIGCLSGTVAQCGDKEEEVFALRTKNNAAIIPVAMLDTATRELVESLLKAQEEK